MNHHYADIRDRIAERPRWWDEHAVPRYSLFTPKETSDIYADEAALALIRCQNCGHEFQVAFTSGSMDVVLERPSVSALIERGDLHYGDPPNIGCCPAGPTMNSIPVRVLGFYERNASTSHEWVRRPELEREIDCGWAS